MSGSDGDTGRARIGSDTRASAGIGSGVGAGAGGEDEDRFGPEFGFEVGGNWGEAGAGRIGRRGTGGKYCEL